jgi:hypothetical protein
MVSMEELLGGHPFFTGLGAGAVGDGRAVTPVSAIALDGTCLRGKCEADANSATSC